MAMRSLAAVALLALASGCASIVEGTSQTISVSSAPEGAECKFERDGAIIASFTTPTGVVVEKTKHDITLTCQKAGYQTASSMLPSDIEGYTFGNIILGGFIGWGIDSASGADNKYPEFVTVTLLPAEGGAALQDDLAEKLRVIDGLVAEGLISDEEAQMRKRKLLDEAL